jgi:uncharacterized protein YaaN involved in tellurite resistance
MTGAALDGDVFTADLAVSVEELQRARQALLTDIAQLDMLYEECVAKSRKTLVSIRDGEIKLGALRAQHAASAARAAGGMHLNDSPEARDLADMISAPESRVRDLKLATMIAEETAQQIRSVRASGRELIKMVQSCIDHSRTLLTRISVNQSIPEIPAMVETEARTTKLVTRRAVGAMR